MYYVLQRVLCEPFIHKHRLVFQITCLLYLNHNVLTQSASAPFATGIKGITENWGKKNIRKKKHQEKKTKKNIDTRHACVRNIGKHNVIGKQEKACVFVDDCQFHHKARCLDMYLKNCRQSSGISGRDRIVVSTSRCGRDNPGSNPGYSTFLQKYSNSLFILIKISVLI